MHNELTPKDIADMEKEIEYRKLVLRPQILDDVKEARAQGDLSENFEYYAAKQASTRLSLSIFRKMMRKRATRSCPRCARTPYTT